MHEDLEISAEMNSEKKPDARSALSEFSVRMEQYKVETPDTRKHALKKKRVHAEQKEKSSSEASEAKAHEIRANQAQTNETTATSKRLSFEDEAKTENAATNLGGRFSSVSGKAATAAGNVVNSSIDQEDDNAGAETVRRTEIAAVNAPRTMNRSTSKKSRVSSKRTTTVEQAAEVKGTRLMFEAEEGAASSVARQSKTVSEAVSDSAKGSGASNAQKAFQKKKLGRQYAQQVRASKAVEVGAGGAQTAAEAGEKTVSIGSRVKNFFSGVVRNNKGTLAAFLAVGIFMVAVIGAVGTVGSLISGGGNAMIESTYLASDDEIYAAENEYAGKEAALQRQVDTIESTYPGYDKYRYQVDEIAHNPYQLTSYLTAKYGNYTFADVQEELTTLFRQQYSISVTSSTETITETREVHVGESLGTVVTSGYCNCRICCGSWSGGPTASGVYPTSNHTIAVDASNPTVPMGTKVVMNGVEYTVEDTGNFARYGVDFDVYYDSHAAASAHGHQVWEAYLADDNGSRTVTVTQTRTVRVLNVTVANAGFDQVARNNLPSDAINYYNILNASYGNRDYLWDVTEFRGYNPGGMSYEIPPEALSDVKFRNMITEAEKYLGYPYVWGGSSPGTSFDCSGFVSWVINNCGNGWNYGRLTAEGLRGICTYVSPNQAKPGDLIFFQGTYNTTGASHVGIYVGNGMMIHCGNPIQYTSIESSYWQQHFLCFGRIN